MKAFLKAGILSEEGADGTRSPARPREGSSHRCLANIALSVLDEHFAEAWQHMGGTSDAATASARGWPPTASSAMRTISWCWWPAPGSRRGAARRGGSGARPDGLRLSEEKTRIAHIDEGFDFLGFRIQRQPKRGSAEAHRLHLPDQDGTGRGQGEGAGDDAGARTRPLAVLLLPAQPGRFEDGPTTSGTACREDLRLPPPSPGGGWSVGSATSTPRPTGNSSVVATSRVVADGRRGDVVRPEHGPGHSATATGDADPDAVDERR